MSATSLAMHHRPEDEEGSLNLSIIPAASGPVTFLALSQIQEQGKGGRGGPDKKNEKNQDKSGGNPNPTQGGQTLSPLVGSKIRGLRPVLKRRLKRNKNKEPSVAMKMETSRKPHAPPPVVPFHQFL